MLSCFTRNGGNPDKNPFASPIEASDSLLNLLPNMVIFAAECDVLRDHSILFMDRMLKADKGKTKDRCKLFYMREYIHGFCSMDTKHVGVEEFNVGTKITCAQFREMFLGFSTFLIDTIEDQTYTVI